MSSNYPTPFSTARNFLERVLQMEPGYLRCQGKDCRQAEVSGSLEFPLQVKLMTWSDSIRNKVKSTIRLCRCLLARYVVCLSISVSLRSAPQAWVSCTCWSSLGIRNPGLLSFDSSYAWDRCEEERQCFANYLMSVHGVQLIACDSGCHRQTYWAMKILACLSDAAELQNFEKMQACCCRWHS